MITYTDVVFGGIGASLGSTLLTTDSNGCCLLVSITFVADTTSIVPFSVPGASGFENFAGHGSVLLQDFNPSTGSLQTLTANFLDGQIYVSVDQANGGVGFGSHAGGRPTRWVLMRVHHLSHTAVTIWQPISR
jgi:hypothetical protein